MNNITTYKLIGEKSGNPEVVEVIKPKVKKEGGGLLTETDHELFHKTLAAKGIHHVPKHIYQMMFDMAPRNNSEYEIEEAKCRTRRFLDSWVTDNFPNQELVNFMDFSLQEARAIHPSLRWGMYIQVQSKDKALTNPIWVDQKALPNINTLIQDIK